MHDLVEYVCSKGHTKIAYIAGNDTSVTKNRLGSFYRSLEKRGIDTPDEYVMYASYRDPETAYKCTKKLLALKDRPTCIMYSDDYSCIGGINAIRDEGLDIPGDISVVGYDGSYISQILEPKLTTLEQDTEQIGRIAAEKLIHLIENPKTTLIQRMVIDGHLIEGGSVAEI